MKKQEIIQNLILQDLKHNQLTIGLDKIGLEGTDLHNLGILELVSNLMKVPKALQADWAHVYLLCMEESVKYEITDNGASLKSLAKVSYLKLKKLVDKSSE